MNFNAQSMILLRVERVIVIVHGIRYGVRKPLSEITKNYRFSYVSPYGALSHIYGRCRERATRKPHLSARIFLNTNSMHALLSLSRLVRPVSRMVHFEYATGYSVYPLSAQRFRLHAKNERRIWIKVIADSSSMQMT